MNFDLLHEPKCVVHELKCVVRELKCVVHELVRVHERPISEVHEIKTCS